MNTSKILLSAAALALLVSSPAFATSDADTGAAPSVETTAPADAAPPAMEAPPAVDATTEAAPATIDTATPPADGTMDATTPPADDAAAAPATEEAAPAATTEAAPVEEAPKPKPKKKAPPAKLSALSKKYDLMSLDTDGNKSLSKEEFTANGFSNAKTFASFDSDHNGKLTNSEINAYAARIEANSGK